MYSKTFLREMTACQSIISVYAHLRRTDEQWNKDTRGFPREKAGREKERKGGRTSFSSEG